MNTRRAFTLVEILTVIVIISILAALVTVAVAGAMRAGKRAAIATEMSQIAMALEQYKNEFGEYPPDFFDDDALVRHVKKRWPRFMFSDPLPGEDVTRWHASSIRQALGNVYMNQNVYTPAMRGEWMGSQLANVWFTSGVHSSKLASLCVWLGGFPDAEGKFIGFGADPEAPFGRRANGNVNCGHGETGVNVFSDVTLGTPDKKNFIELTVNKNVYFAGQADAFVPCIVSRISSDKVVPIIYFRGKSDGGTDAYYYWLQGNQEVKRFEFNTNFASGVRGLAEVSHWQDCGIVVPYARSGDVHLILQQNATVVWVEPTKYQLIHPGLDSVFGALGAQPRPLERVISTGAGIGPYDLDNLTNFSGGKELKSILP